MAHNQVEGLAMMSVKHSAPSGPRICAPRHLEGVMMPWDQRLKKVRKLINTYKKYIKICVLSEFYYIIKGPYCTLSILFTLQFPHHNKILFDL